MIRFFQGLELSRRDFPIIGTFPLLAAAALVFAPYARAAAPEAVFSVRMTVAVIVTNASDVTLDVLLPHDIEGVQTITNVHFEPRPVMIFREDGQSYARYAWPRPAATNRIALSFHAALQASPATGPFLLARPATNDLRAEKFIESNDREILRLALTLSGRTDEQRARAALAVVTNRLAEGDYDPEDRGAAETLKRGKGDCTDFADLYVALCRAAGIPARTVQGFLMTPPRPDDTRRHDWAEVWLRGRGWVHVDPFHVELGHGRFGERPAYLLRMDTHRSNPVLKGFHGYHATARGEDFDVTDTIEVERIRP